MARRMVGDDQDVYRVLITCRERRDNPDWVRGPVGPGNPRVLFDGPEFTTAYGPYNSLGAARGQLTSHTPNEYGWPQQGFVRGRIQKAHTVWEDVE
ncbi:MULTISPECIES: hypothetical protein [unclassified Streptomyces]|uniref:hypothetical protein n=1 Tax=unclassified Streptomyces TaxID=2593676 RepID=UPI00340158DC